MYVNPSLIHPSFWFDLNGSKTVIIITLHIAVFANDRSAHNSRDIGVNFVHGRVLVCMILQVELFEQRMWLAELSSVFYDRDNWTEIDLK